MIRVELPAGLRSLAQIEGSIELIPADPVTLRTLLDALECRYPPLLGTLRDQRTGHRRPFIRFFACAQDLSHLPADTPLPAPVRAGTEPLLIVGAIAGG